MVQTVLQSQVEQDAVLVAIDVECHCRDQTREQQRAGIKTNKRRICDIGVSVLDTRKIGESKPGDRGINFVQLIEPFALAVKENIHNAKGCSRWCTTLTPSMYLFGSTKYISKVDVNEEIKNIIVPYIDKPSTTYCSTSEDQSKLPISCDQQAHSWNRDCCEQARAGKQGYRKVVFLYFDSRNDMIWLKEHDADLAAEFPNHNVIDIQRLGVAGCTAQARRKPKCSGHDLVTALGIQVINAHNGANDGFFEMQAYIAGSCLTSEQQLVIIDGGSVMPELPAAYSMDGPGLNSQLLSAPITADKQALPALNGPAVNNKSSGLSRSAPKSLGWKGVQGTEEVKELEERMVSINIQEVQELEVVEKAKKEAEVKTVEGHAKSLAPSKKRGRKSWKHFAL